MLTAETVSARAAELQNPDDVANELHFIETTILEAIGDYPHCGGVAIDVEAATLELPHDRAEELKQKLRQAGFHCDVLYDHAAGETYCTNMIVRWGEGHLYDPMED